MKIQPLIVVKDVEESSQFYQTLLQCDSGHGGPEYEMLSINSELILQLHAQDVHEHPEMFKPEAEVGNGIILWFRTHAFDQAVLRAKEMKVEIVAEPHVNPLANQNEIWLKDLDGYLIVISGNPGDVA